MLTKLRFLPLLLTMILFGQAVSAQSSNSEVFVFEVKNSEGQIELSNPLNISNSPGYDNQPSFGPGDKSILFTSIRDGNSPDIYEYFFTTKLTKQITTSSDSEYTPRAMGDETITFVREGKGQEMSVWSYGRSTKSEAPALTNKEPVAYYDWNSNGAALVWIRYASMAHFVNPSKSINLFVSDHVLPSTPHNIPGTLKFSFVHRQGNDEIWIKEFDPETRAVRSIVQTKDAKLDYCWMPDGSLVMGSGTKLYRFVEKVEMDWILLADLSEFGLKEITRLDASKDGKKLAVVSNQ